MHAAVNRYASRGHKQARLIDRVDPVVYSNNSVAGPLAPEFIEEYIENGFVLIEGLFTDEEIHALQQETVRLRDDPETRLMQETITEPGNGEVRSVFMVHANNTLFRRLAADPRLAGIAQYILNDDVYIHQSRLNYKPGFRGKEFYWHADFETWHMEDGMPAMRALSISVTLTENLACNGPLMLIPGSHMEYAVCPGVTPDAHYKQSLKKQEYGIPDDLCLGNLVARHGIALATGKPGTVVIFDCNTMHGSGSNITPYPRSNVFYVYNAISNRLETPISGQPPRPEYIAGRKDIEIIPRRIPS
jgi:ectoine hydroxylase